jgi:hypothetical protein
MASIDTDIYLEVGKRRTFAVALAWPGWARAGRTEDEAVQTLFEYAPRYLKVARRLGFELPRSVADLNIRERLDGDASTDMGSLTGNEPVYDSTSVDAAAHERLEQFLKASWRALDAAAERASGKALRAGARGGGRSIDKILQHVLDAEGGYLRRLEYKRSKEQEADSALTRAAILEALGASVRGEVPEFGPRGGKRWSARYFVRREAWHVLDHAWEIQDRTG